MLDKKSIGPRNIILKIYTNLWWFLLRLYSARYLLPALPKKFVMKIVMNRQKLKIRLMEPKVSLPKVLATRKLNVNGVIPTNAKAKPV